MSLYDLIISFACRLVFKNREFYSHVKETHPEWLGVDLVKRFKINDEEYDCTVCGIVYKTRKETQHT